MTSDQQLKVVQEKIGKVHDDMRENMEAVSRRQGDVEGISSKSASLQASASQFSQVATRIRQDQMMQIYRFYTIIVLGFVTLGVVVVFWDEPLRLFIGIGVMASLVGVALYLFRRWKNGSVALADSLAERQEMADLEAARE